MQIIGRLPSLDDAYKGMNLLRDHAIPPALAQNGQIIVISVDDDFAEPARKLFDQHAIRYSEWSEDESAASIKPLLDNENT